MMKRFHIKTLRYRIVASIALIAILAITAFIIFSTQKKPITWPKNDNDKKVVILGFDGTEHTLLEKWMAEGKLPNLTNLTTSGSYSTLNTTIPAQSPVAWSSFATGTNPGKHDVMDFIIRDPETYAPSIGMANVNTKTLGKPEITSKKQGENFWDILSKNGIESKIIKVPITFPAQPINGELLTGLGTPDAMGTIGTFSYYTTEDTDYNDNDQAYNLYKLSNENKIDTVVRGPKKYTQKLTINRLDDSIELTLGGKETTLRVGEWTDYTDVSFNILGPFLREKGIAKFYLEESKPNLKLYLSPISFDPNKPFYEISYPSGYSKTLAKENGNYKTLGWSIDTWALKEERVSEDVFIQDLNSTFDEEIKVMKSELAKANWNVYVQVFQATDFIQHMFWRYMDTTSPRFENNEKYQDAILSVYKKMDNLVGEVQSALPKDTTLIVMSDHGFSPYNKSVDLNAWLVYNGYMTLKDPEKRGDWLKNVYNGEDFWDNIDWSKTKAYALGLGSVYINLEDREGQGIVNESEYSKVRTEIQNGLLSLKDGNTDVISNVYKREDVMYGANLGDAADLIIGFSKGYRVSWQTTFGAVPKQAIFPNDNKWSGDHCSVDPKLIPGIFISNQKFTSSEKSILDIAPTILNIFDVQPSAEMDGKVLTFDL